MTRWLTQEAVDAHQRKHGRQGRVVAAAAAKPSKMRNTRTAFAGLKFDSVREAIRFTIIGEPASLKNSRKLVRHGTRPAFIKSDKARGYEESALNQIPPNARKMLKGDLSVTISIYYASRRPDLDEAGLLDIMQSKFKGGIVERCGVYLNDRQVKEKHIYWMLDRENPRAEILVEKLCSLP